ncbi:MAG: 4Fe-4S binding protein [Actinobacteria bacterium]|nr:4Fe-4S binding protein [Actinomycetota bacterium]MBU1942268.1 4Fe-4S binding protein [Actinomycetota bacterium]MBU2687383.1 4Fe-4S binding protein [Actinomycetota bacterium]
MPHVPDIKVIKERCVACGDCITLCPQSGEGSTSPVLDMGEGTVAVLDYEACIACYTCVEYCRAAAIHIVQEASGHEGQPDLYLTRPVNRIV